MTFKDIRESLYEGVWVIEGKRFDDPSFRTIGVCNVTSADNMSFITLDPKYPKFNMQRLNECKIDRVDADKAIPIIRIYIDE